MLYLYIYKEDGANQLLCEQGAKGPKVQRDSIKQIQSTLEKGYISKAYTEVQDKKEFYRIINTSEEEFPICLRIEKEFFIEKGSLYLLEINFDFQRDKKFPLYEFLNKDDKSNSEKALDFIKKFCFSNVKVVNVYECDMKDQDDLSNKSNKSNKSNNGIAKSDGSEKKYSEGASQHYEVASTTNKRKRKEEKDEEAGVNKKFKENDSSLEERKEKEEDLFVSEEFYYGRGDRYVLNKTKYGDLDVYEVSNLISVNKSTGKTVRSDFIFNNLVWRNHVKEENIIKVRCKRKVKIFIKKCAVKEVNLISLSDFKEKIKTKIKENKRPIGEIIKGNDLVFENLKYGRNKLCIVLSSDLYCLDSGDNNILNPGVAESKGITFLWQEMHLKADLKPEYLQTCDSQDEYRRFLGLANEKREIEKVIGNFNNIASVRSKDMLRSLIGRKIILGKDNFIQNKGYLYIKVSALEGFSCKTLEEFKKNPNFLVNSSIATSPSNVFNSRRSNQLKENKLQDTEEHLLLGNLNT